MIYLSSYLSTTEILIFSRKQFFTFKECLNQYKINEKVNDRCKGFPQEKKRLKERLKDLLQNMRE